MLPCPLTRGVMPTWGCLTSIFAARQLRVQWYLKSTLVTQGVNSIDIMNFGHETGRKTGPSSGPHSVQGRTKPWVIGSPSLQCCAGQVGLRHQLVRFYDADDIQNASFQLNWNDNIEKAHVFLQMIHERCSWRWERLHNPCDPLQCPWNFLCVCCKGIHTSMRKEDMQGGGA